MSSTASVERGAAGRDGRDGVLLRFPYSKAVQERLMDEIQPPRDRHWDPDRECWWVAADQEVLAVAILHSRHPEVLILTGTGESDYYLTADGEIVEQGGLW